MEIENASTGEQTPDESNLEELVSQLTAEVGDWEKWLKPQKKDTREPLRKLINKNALFWGLSTNQTIHQPLIARLVSLKSRPSKNASAKKETDFDFGYAAAAWVQGSREDEYGQTKQAGPGEQSEIPTCLEAIAWAHALPELAFRLPGDEADGQPWIELLAFLISQTRPRLSSHDDGTNAAQTGQEGVGRFILSVELPLVLAYGLPQLPSCKSLRQVAKEQFSSQADILLDGEGTPHARYLADIQFLLASCTRSLVIDAQSKKHRIAKQARLQFDWLTRQTLRWARPNGANILSESLDSPYFDDMIKHATKLTQDKIDIAAARTLRGKRVSSDVELPPPSGHSEWSELASMRIDWTPRSATLAINYSRRSLRSELSVGSETIFSGQSEPQIIVNGKGMDLTSDWEAVCWEMDDDLDYLELEAKLEDNWRLQRQYVLARRDKFAFIADAIIGPETAHIEYQHTLPICEDIAVEQNSENTDAMILGRKKIGPILPLSLSEWKSGQGNDRFREEPTRLELSTRAKGLYAPLFFGLDPAKRNQSLTWRQLTVAENLLAVSNDVAVAYRIQIGKSQWVIYRSISKAGNRTFLGMNLVSDFYIARLQDGEPEMIIDVEPS